MINDVLSAGFQGIQEATNKASEAAQEIASQSINDTRTQGLDSDDLVNSVVKLNQAEIEAKANAKVVDTASDLIGTILDVTV